jgi:hypothetical protein
MLRIILEFHHVEMAVIGAHQMRLRSSAHPSYVLDGFDWHGGILALSNECPAVDHSQHTEKSLKHKEERSKRRNVG